MKEPKPIHKSCVCSECGVEWSKHTGTPVTLETCVRLLKATRPTYYNPRHTYYLPRPRSSTTLPIPRSSTTLTTGGWQCARCGTWVMPGNAHVCHSVYRKTLTPWIYCNA